MASSRASSQTSGSRMLMPMTASSIQLMINVYTKATGSSMVVARHAHRLRQALVLNRGLQHHAFVKLRHHLALDLLPWCLALGIGEPAVLSERGATLVQLLVPAHDSGRALLLV